MQYFFRKNNQTISRYIFRVGISIVLILAIVLSGCSKENPNQNTDKADKTDNSGLYIAFTVTNGTGEDSFESHSFCYDLDTEQLDEVGVVPYTSQYPFTAYDRKNNKIYYSSRDASKSDQLCEYDIETKKTTELTHDIFAMNYIVPFDDEILLIAAPKFQTLTLLPYIWDKKSKKLKEAEWDTDLLIDKMYINPFTHEAICGAYSVSEYDRRMELQSEEQPFVMPESSIYRLLGKESGMKLLTVEEEGASVSKLVSYGDSILYSAYNVPKALDILRENPAADNNRFFNINLSNMKSTPYQYEDKLARLVDIVYIPDDGKYLYFIRHSDTGTNELCKYDAASDTTKVIYSAKSGYEELNNAIILNG